MLFEVRVVLNRTIISNVSFIELFAVAASPADLSVHSCTVRAGWVASDLPSRLLFVIAIRQLDFETKD
jgi:hypothetical protein